VLALGDGELHVRAQVGRQNVGAVPACARVCLCVCIIILCVGGLLRELAEYGSLSDGLNGCVWCGVPAAVEVEPMVRTKARLSSFICHGRGRKEERNE